MEILSVTRDVEGTTGLVELPICDIAFMVYIKKINRVVLHTVDEEFYLTGTLVYWQTALAASGHRFISVDRTNVVNIDRIRYMDEIRHNAYFVSEPTSKSKRCTLTNIRFAQIVNMIQIPQNSHLLI